MTIKISAYEYGTNPSEHGQELGVRFEVGEGEGIKFLVGLEAFLAAFNAGRALEPVLQAQQPPEPVAVEAAPAVVAPVRSRKRAVPTPEEVVQVEHGPVVIETVTPPLAATLAPKAAPAAAVSSPPSPPAATHSAPVSSLAPAAVVPTPTTAGAASEAAATPELLAALGLPPTPPPALAGAKSFRDVMVYLYSHGVTTQAGLESVCRAYAPGVPAVARMLTPNPDPEASLEKRIERAISVLSNPQA